MKEIRCINPAHINVPMEIWKKFEAKNPHYRYDFNKNGTVKSSIGDYDISDIPLEMRNERMFNDLTPSE